MDDALCNQMEKKSAGLKVSMSNVGTYGASFAHHRGRQRAKWQRRRTRRTVAEFGEAFWPN